MDDIIITTTNDLPGYEVTQVHGEVFGLIVRARNVFSNIGAGFRTVFGGEAKGYTTLLTDSRNEAVERLKEAARAKGANAVLAMRFDCNEIADIMSEVAAYGTAVTVRRVLACATLRATCPGQRTTPESRSTRGDRPPCNRRRRRGSSA